MKLVLQRIVAALVALLVLAGALVFASIALGVLLVAGLAGWAWLWWRGRKLRRSSGVIIEGEVRDAVVVERIEHRER
jgi:uncharacterized membrane protein YccC